MIKVSLIGTGNMTSHLFRAFLKSDNVSVVQVLGRNKKELSEFEKHTEIAEDFDNIKKSDVYIIAISDDAIAAVAEQFKTVDGLVVHTSGSVPIDHISTVRRGSFYPVQSLSKTRKVDFTTIPICIEAENKKDEKLLLNLAKTISDNVAAISYDQRKSLHLAAVFVNNFANHLYGIGEHICEENELPFDLIRPLILETAQKMRTLSPTEAQTGPARRNDAKTIARHLDQIKNKKLKEIYTLLTESILENYGEKL